jgi:hypothetical protein
MIRKLAISTLLAAVSLAPVSAAIADTVAAGASTTVAAPATPAAPAKTVSAKQQAQRDKMKSCNADATSKSLKGADRKTYMSTCLKG